MRGEEGERFFTVICVGNTAFVSILAGCLMYPQNAMAVVVDATVDAVAVTAARNGSVCLQVD